MLIKEKKSHSSPFTQAIAPLSQLKLTPQAKLVISLSLPSTISPTQEQTSTAPVQLSVKKYRSNASAKLTFTTPQLISENSATDRTGAFSTTNFNSASVPQHNKSIHDVNIPFHVVTNGSITPMQNKTEFNELDFCLLFFFAPGHISTSFSYAQDDFPVLSTAPETRCLLVEAEFDSLVNALHVKNRMLSCSAFTSSAFRISVEPIPTSSRNGTSEWQGNVLSRPFCGLLEDGMIESESVRMDTSFDEIVETGQLSMKRACVIGSNENEHPNRPSSTYGEWGGIGARSFSLSDSMSSFSYDDFSVDFLSDEDPFARNYNSFGGTMPTDEFCFFENPNGKQPIPATYRHYNTMGQRSMSISGIPNEVPSSQFSLKKVASTLPTCPSFPSVIGENAPCNTLYVGNLPSNACEDELRMLFCRCIGYKRLSFKNKPNGPMCFVEFEDIHCATVAMNELYGTMLSNSCKAGIRLSYSKNPLGVKPLPMVQTCQPALKGPCMTLQPFDLIPGPVIQKAFSPPLNQLNMKNCTEHF